MTVRLSLLGTLDDRFPPTRKEFRELHLKYHFPVVIVLLGVCVLVSSGHAHWTEFVLGITAWLAGERLKEILADLLPSRQSVLTLVYVVVQETFRLGLGWACLINKYRSRDATEMSKKPHYYPVDDLFYRLFWAGLGWAVIEALASCLSFWNHMKLYDPLLAEYEHEEGLSEPGDAGLETIAEEPSGDPSAIMRFQEAQDQEDEAVDIIQDDIRYHMESMLGMTLYSVPVALVLIWRLDSFLLSLNLVLLETYPLQWTQADRLPHELASAWLLGLLIHGVVASAWLHLTRRVGLAVVCYVTLVSMLALFLVLLNIWHIIV